MNILMMYELINMTMTLGDNPSITIKEYEFLDDGRTFKIKLSNGNNYFFEVN